MPDKTTKKKKQPVAKKIRVVDLDKDELPKATRRMGLKKKSKETKHKVPDGLNFWQRMQYKKKLRKEERARKRAEDLATLPKNPFLRFFAHFAPKRVFRYWFSLHGLWVFTKIVIAFVLIAVIAIGGLFIYYKNQLKDIQLADITISDTVNTYLDRNGVVLWEDKGSSDYRLVVDGSNIATYMRQATVAIEDKNFYNHPGVDFIALVRATISTVSGKGVQGGSTLTQQLIKQIYFSDEAASEDRGGLSRKIKELILAVELEKMYDKEQIITMYLNESPYGGRRNGVESAAQTYFGKSAKDLTLAESALLAAIPNNPAVLNPYNDYGHEALIARQHKVLDSMVELNYVTKEEAEEAKSVDIIAAILPETSQYDNMLAPHFVLEVKSYLENKYGISTMRTGGFTIKTTLDYRAQQLAEQAVDAGEALMYMNSSDDISLVSIDVDTSQILAMVGSIDFNIPGYGEVNAATTLLEPGSTIKPVLDYGPLFMQRSGQNFGPGSILKDEDIDSIYCAGTYGKCHLANATGKHYGNVTIRNALAWSLNIPAVKALYINGIDNSLEIAHQLGDVSYCAGGNEAGLSIAIGSGCTVRPVEHANAYASIARGGVYKDYSYVLEVKNSSGDIIESWQDTSGTRVYDEQIAYMISSILSDAKARYAIWNWLSTAPGLNTPGVWTAAKTGTSTNANNNPKDTWLVSYSTKVATVVWNGRHDGTALSTAVHDVTFKVGSQYMERVHKDVFEPDGSWHSGDQPAQPAGMQTLKINGITDIWPSWYNKTMSGVEETTLIFNMFNHKKATSCTKENYKISVDATKTVDPMTKKEVWTVPEPYNAEEEDDCTYNYTFPGLSSLTRSGNTISFVITAGSESLKSYTISVDDTLIETISISAGGEYTYDASSLTGEKAKITVYDVYDGSTSGSVSLPKNTASETTPSTGE
ncbi:penicillin-binding protein [Candidatus Saccharibacteria bacterium]|nr:penicillin-binding protein [Candidatus Saccharibacteria bacterium]